MVNGLVCKEITQSTLDMSWSGAPTLAGFFQFERYDRRFSNTEILRDCHICQMYPVERIDNWPEQPGPPNPAVFRELFPEIVDSFLKHDSRLYLHVKAVDPEFFDEVSVVTQTIGPLGTEYMFLSPVASKRAPNDIGNLIFECPATLISEVTENWFRSPTIEMEAYVMNKEEFGRLPDCYFRPDSVETIRQVLSIMRVGFRLWPDFNGMDLFSELYSAEALAL